MRNYRLLAAGVVLLLALNGCSNTNTAGGAAEVKSAQETVDDNTKGTAAGELAPGTAGENTDGTAGENAEGTDGENADSTAGENADSAAAAQEGLVTFTDGLGYEVRVKPTDHAAVLSGSFADCWMLAGGRLDAVTEDVYNEKKVQVPQDTVDLGMLKSPSMELLVGSGTEFIVLSANIEEHVALRDNLEKAGIVTAYFDVETFEDYLDMLKVLTDITGREDLYKKHGTDIRAEIDAQIARVDESQPTVLFMRAFSTGVRAKGSERNMTGQMLKDLGCINIADDDKSLLDDLSMESIIAQDPDYIFVTTMGSSEEAAMKTVEDMLVSNPAWSELKAVKNDRYYVLPRGLFHNKPNNRWGESYRMLADILYGENKSE